METYTHKPEYFTLKLDVRHSNKTPQIDRNFPLVSTYKLTPTLCQTFPLSFTYFECVTSCLWGPSMHRVRRGTCVIKGVKVGITHIAFQPTFRKGKGPFIVKDQTSQTFIQFNLLKFL